MFDGRVRGYVCCVWGCVCGWDGCLCVYFIFSSQIYIIRITWRIKKKGETSCYLVCQYLDKLHRGKDLDKFMFTEGSCEDAKEDFKNFLGLLLRYAFNLRCSDSCRYSVVFLFYFFFFWFLIFFSITYSYTFAFSNVCLTTHNWQNFFKK